MNRGAIGETQRGIEYTLKEVSSRGWTDKVLDDDVFSELRKERRFRDAIVAALYEEYFLPERHEFEWQILADIVSAVQSSPASAIAGGLAMGVLGNAAYDLLKKLAQFSSERYRKQLGKAAEERANAFLELGADAEKLKQFFMAKKRARVGQIEKATGISREKIHPLLKLAGFRHSKRKNACFWSLPD